MNSIVEKFSATTKTSLQAFEGIATQAQANFEKLTELNLAASKAALQESFSHVQSLLGAKDAQQLAALQKSFIAPLTEKSASYTRHVQAIFAGAGTEFTKSVEAKSAETQKAIGDLISNVTKNAPAGSESAVAAFKGALASGQAALETAQASAKKAIEVAQSNFAAATRLTTDAVHKAANAG